MCNVRRTNNEADRILHLRSGLVIVKSENNGNLKNRVNLTRKTVRDGSVKYGVTLTKLGTHRHTMLNTFNNITDAWAVYKTLRSA